MMPVSVADSDHKGNLVPERNAESMCGKGSLTIRIDIQYISYILETIRQFTNLVNGMTLTGICSAFIGRASNSLRWNRSATIIYPCFKKSLILFNRYMFRHTQGFILVCRSDSPHTDLAGWNEVLFLF